MSSSRTVGGSLERIFAACAVEKPTSKGITNEIVSSRGATRFAAEPAPKGETADDEEEAALDEAQSNIGTDNSRLTSDTCSARHRNEGNVVLICCRNG